MLLALDIGNTKIKTGLFPISSHSKEGKIFIHDYKNFSSEKTLQQYLKSTSFSYAAISSVVPEKTKLLKNFLTNEFSISPFVISKDSNFNLKIKYHTPATLGIDRICASEGAFLIYKNSAEFGSYDIKTFLIIIDFGTATTINVISYPAKFIGGTIAPGIKMMSRALTKNTAQLPEFGLNDYKKIIGTDTKSSLASGVLNAAIGLIERVINNLKLEHGASKIKIFITGGNSKQLLPYLNFEYEFEKALVLKGIKALFDINKK